MVNNLNSWMEWPKSDRAIFQWSREFSSKYYNLASIAEIGPTATEYFWEKELANARGKTQSGVYLFRRK
jgi:hypothetical protein